MEPGVGAAVAGVGAFVGAEDGANDCSRESEKKRLLDAAPAAKASPPGEQYRVSPFPMLCCESNGSIPSSGICRVRKVNFRVRKRTRNHADAEMLTCH